MLLVLFKEKKNVRQYFLTSFLCVAPLSLIVCEQLKDGL